MTSSPPPSAPRGTGDPPAQPGWLAAALSLRAGDAPIVICPIANHDDNQHAPRRKPAHREPVVRHRPDGEPVRDAVMIRGGKLTGTASVALPLAARQARGQLAPDQLHDERRRVVHREPVDRDSGEKSRGAFFQLLTHASSIFRRRSSALGVRALRRVRCLEATGPRRSPAPPAWTLSATCLIRHRVTTTEGVGLRGGSPRQIQRVHCEKDQPSETPI